MDAQALYALAQLRASTHFLGDHGIVKSSQEEVGFHLESWRIVQRSSADFRKDLWCNAFSCHGINGEEIIVDLRMKLMQFLQVERNNQYRAGHIVCCLGGLRKHTRRRNSRDRIR